MTKEKNLIGHKAIISDKQLGDITLLEPMSRVFAEQTGSPCAMFVKDAFRPLIDLMPHAVWGPSDTRGCYTQTWTTSWGSRAIRSTLLKKSKHKTLLINMPSHRRWWHKLVFNEVRFEAIGGEYWGKYFWRISSTDKQRAFHSPQLLRPPEEWRHAKLPKEDFILINPTAAWPNKYWLPASWQELLESSSFETQLPVVMTGGSTELEKAHCKNICDGLERKITDLSGNSTMQQYLHALSRAKLVICVDGSASHLAQAFGVPVVTLFGPVFEAKWHWPTPTHVAVCARNYVINPNPTSADIPVSAVINSILQLGLL